jgi:RimJ/RimL family protein N-acetyltransferase
MLELREGDRRTFFQVPFRVYGRNSLYVSPLDHDLARFLDDTKNPLFVRFGSRRFFVALRDGAPVGRIVAHVHRASNERFGWRRAYFGYFDCANDPEAARLLLGAAEAHGRAAGCDEILGNFNLTAMQQIGVLTDGFDRAPYSDQHWNPPHIPALLAACGYRPTFPMTTFELQLADSRPETLLGPKQREALVDPGLEWPPIDLRQFPQLLEDLRTVLNDGFANNPMFVPLTRDEFFFQARDMSQVMDPAITILVRDHAGPVGAVINIPDLNPLLRALRSRITWTAPWHLLRFRARRDRAVLIFISVAQRWQNHGLAGAILHRSLAKLRERGYRSVGYTWVSDGNLPSLRQAEKLGARPLHRLHLFRKELPS